MKLITENGINISIDNLKHQNKIIDVIEELIRESVDSDVDTNTVTSEPTLKYSEVPVVECFEDISLEEFNDILNGYIPIKEVQLRYLCKNHELYNVTKLNTSEITDMSFMFWGAKSFNQDISSWDVSNVVNMRGMFWRAKSFNQDISSWDVSYIAVMGIMFENCPIEEKNKPKQIKRSNNGKSYKV